ncbi:uncharacterized protein LOC133195272 [Saccostrea echinata]|uniref:uncharacterized protein LOC133195272 n=1 Tax=Saccostrea echinata TaxID=191078 RepID=UPI002A83370C|nr:uncharacterized protein LOC133195272 [Saccostrea echinata]
MSRRDYAITKREDTVQYTLKDVKDCDDIEYAFDIGDALDVNLGGLSDLDSIKERLIMHIEKEKGNFKTQTIDKLMEFSREDERKRQKILELLKAIQGTLEKFEVQKVPSQQHKQGSAALEELLVTEGSTKSFKIDFNQRISQVKTGECMVVVSGETCAGKSSFLNLLLGEDILPVHHNPCNAVITKISYGVNRSARIVHMNGETEEIEDIHKREKKEMLWNKIFEKDLDKREKAPRISEVQLSLPITILRSGIVLVDSPGIGENSAMDSVVTQFVSQHHIMGFIYVIKSDNAGGVDEDRLGNLLKVILDKQKKKSDDAGTLFDPKCAIFVCNVWDNVKKDEQEQVYEHVVGKLENYWPGLVRSSVIRFSTKRAKQELSVDTDYITKDYRLFLEGLKELVAKATDKRIKATYKWMETVLVRSVHHLKTIVKSVDDNEQHLKGKMKYVHEKLQTLRLKSEGVLKDQKAHIDTSVKEICQAFEIVLNQPATHFRLVHWLNQDLINIRDDDPWPEVKQKIHDMLLNRITDEFTKWEEDNKKCQNVEQEMFTQIKSELHLLQSDLVSIEGELHSDSDSVSSEEYYDLKTRRKSSFPSIKIGRCGDYDIGALHAQPLPVKLIGKFLHPFNTLAKTLRHSSLFETYEFAKWNRKTEAYRKDPLNVAKLVSEKFLQRFLHPEKGEENQLLNFVSEIFDRPRELLEVIEENVPAMIQANEKLLDQISHCRVNVNESRETYEKMMEGLEILKHQLMEYGTGQIYVDDFMGREIRFRDEYNDYGDSGDFRCSAIILSCSNNSRGDRRIHRGIWTALQNAILYDEDEKCDEAIIIKVYLPLAGILETFAEVTKLRFLDHPCVAKFLGIHHSDSPIPAFVYMDHLRSLKIYKELCFCNLRVEIPRILEEVVQGLEYLHNQKLVHMELCQNTITVDFDGNVKLSGGCLPRCANFPMDKESIGVGDFAYLSPDVLRGEIYVACADVYALGLLIYEMLLNARCFDNQRMMTLDLFTSKVDPIGMNDVVNKCQEVNMTESTKNLILWCMDPSADKRPAVQVIAEMSDFKNEKCAQNLRRSGFQTRRHQAVRRIPSKQAY